MYRVDVDASPAYELIVSLWAYTSRKERKTLDLGAGWTARVRAGLSDGLRARLDRGERGEEHSKTGLPVLLVWQCSRKETVDGFLEWLGRLAPGELYERLSPYLRDDDLARLRDLGGWRDDYLALLTAWNEQYFRAVDPAIPRGLASDAAAKSAGIGMTSPRDLVEAATSGVLLEPAPGLDAVLLVPQYHYRPWNLTEEHRGLRIILYPADAVAPGEPGDPPLALLRLTRALADENRLRILRFLAPAPRGFTEIVAMTGLAKSTVHYHMVSLRAAGLVRVHDAADGTRSYSLRVDALDTLRGRLGAFLEGS